MELTLSTFGKIISTDNTSEEILKSIDKQLRKSNTVNVNAEDVVISTKCARLIFGTLYKRLKKNEFNKKIQFKNASPSFMFAINEGILTELRSNKKVNTDNINNIK